MTIEISSEKMPRLTDGFITLQLGSEGGAVASGSGRARI